MRIGVIQQGAGNIHSVCRGLKAVGGTPEILTHGRQLDGYERVVLPGVGAFGTAMEMLKRQDMIEPIHAYIASGRPFLGICLGAQLLMETSEEFGEHRGLGLVPGGVVHIPDGPGVRVPHVGWAKIRPARDWGGTCLSDVAPGEEVYFTHSLVCAPRDEADVLARFDYSGRALVAAVGRGAVAGVQFHPELSTDRGLTILRRFIEGRTAVAELVG